MINKILYEYRANKVNLLFKLLTITLISSFLLSGCAEMQFISEAAKRTASNNNISDLTKENGTHYKIGDAYKIKGKWYYPRVDYQYIETGIASWYGPNFHGKKTANGAIFDMNKVSAAHKTLPLPSMVMVTNLDNGRRLKIKVNDRGPYAHNRIIDLSKHAAELLGFIRQGTALVKVELLEVESRELANLMQKSNKKSNFLTKNQPPPPKSAPTVDVVNAEILPPPTGVTQSQPTSKNHVVNLTKRPTNNDINRKIIVKNLSSDNEYQIIKLDKTAPKIFIQAGAFSKYQNAAKTKALLSKIANVNIEQINKGDMPLFRVRLGPINEVAQADKLLIEVNNSGYHDAQIIID